MPKTILSKKLVIAIVMAFVGAVSLAGLVATDSVFAATCGNSDTSVISCSTSENGIWSILLIAINILTAGVGIAAVGGIVYGAVLWTTAEDKEAQITKAKEVITNVVIGIVSFALMYAGLQFLVPGGVFNRDFNVPSGPSLEDSIARPDPNDTNPNDGGNDPPGDGPAGTIGSIRSVRNLRDASGTTSGVLKSGVLLRSGELYKLSRKDEKILSDALGNKGTVIDVRSNSQSAEHPDKPVSGSSNRHIPIVGILDTAPMVNDPARRSQVAKVLKLAANSNGPILIHCSAGKDRTGWLVAMIMIVNGASDAQAMKEYLKSLEAWPGGVKREWLNSGLQAARNKHGTVIKYLKSIGLSDGDLRKLRDKFGA